MMTKFYKKIKELWAAEIQIISIDFGTYISIYIGITTMCLEMGVPENPFPDALFT